ncbi:DUF4232 domain-containing protein [Streptomyces sp. NPDC005202]|uniref:DUF4232 domain-containing protein n=1 Tax=Streptomyces sp. NPDC005202 TaxID=3157021 RepID=UPI0033A21724
MLAAGLALTTCGSTAGHDRAATPANRSVGPSTTSSGTPSAAPKPGECRTSSLKWTLVLLDTKSSSRPNARLTAVNNNPGTCVFAGYPGIETHNGKAESIDGAGHGHPASVTLAQGAGATVDLHYTPRGTKGAGTWCVRQNEALVWAPHDSDRALIPVMDTHHKPIPIDACGEYMSMAPPHYTPVRH